MYRHLLVPLDGSELATTLVTQAVQFAGTLGARISFFSMREDYAATGEGALARTVAPDAFAEAAAGPASAILAKARAAAAGAGVECEAVVRTGRRAYEVILEVAQERGCDLIFMASHGQRGIKAMLLGSHTHKVLTHAAIPVLVATVESNVRSAAADRVIAIIKDEHRAIAAVNQGLRAAAMRARNGEPVELGFLAQLLCYLAEFPDRLHHPKEDRFLFARLRARTDALDTTLDTLSAEHRVGPEQLARIEARLAQCRMPAGGACLQALAEAIDVLVDAQWQHLNTEEKVVLPAARQYLTEADWLEIDAAFTGRDMLARGSAQDLAAREMFARLMNHAD
ncbi:universal stress protein [Zoogloeaceae bacterium G21618-S1]|nr:universal stress protein [Zoogloeaceae bacterium G21618-S1]